MIVLDASVLIAYLDDADAHHARAVQLLLDHLDESLCTSPVTLAETLVGPVRNGRAPAVQSVLAEVGIDVVPLPEDAPLRLAQLRVEHALRLPDCCVLLTAEQTGGRIATFDDRLRTAAGSRRTAG